MKGCDWWSVKVVVNEGMGVVVNEVMGVVVSEGLGVGGQ